MSDNVLELKNIAVEYDGRTVLDVPHSTVQRGEILTLLGENGSGKTTLLRLFGLLTRPARGRVVLDGETVSFGDARRLLELRRRLAAVMQEPLLCKMSVKRNVALGLRFRGLPKAEVEQRVGTWMERLHISHLADRPASKLSGGEAQRASLARAMVLNPEVLFLDEPFSALDAPTRQSQLQELQEVLAESGVTAVFATHDRGEAVALGDRIAVLMKGRIAQVGPTETVFSFPDRVEVARFVGVETLIPGRVRDRGKRSASVDCGAFTVDTEAACEVGEEVHVAVRPEEIDLINAYQDVTGGPPNSIPGCVTRLVPTETHFRVELDCGPSVVAVVSRARIRELAIDVGSRVHATFSPRAAHVIKGHRS